MRTLKYNTKGEVPKGFCPICGENCTNPQGVGSHMKKAHPEQWGGPKKPGQYKRKTTRPYRHKTFGQTIENPVLPQPKAPEPVNKAPTGRMCYCPECGCHLLPYIAASTL